MKKHREGWGCIYSALNLTKDMEYIGKDQSGDPENHRWKVHSKAAASAKPKLYFHRGIKDAGGPTVFEWSVIWRGPLDQMNEKEVYYIAKRHTWVGDPKCRGYNLTQGGEGTWGYTHSKKSKRKISNTQLLSYKEKPERLQKLISTLKRPEVKKLQSYSQLLSYKENPERRQKLSVSLYRWYEDPEHRKSLGVAHQSYWKTNEAHEKASSAQLLSYKEKPERRQKISTACKRRYESITARKVTSDANVRRWANTPQEERSRIGIKARDTRRRNAAKLKKK